MTSAVLSPARPALRTLESAHVWRADRLAAECSGEPAVLRSGHAALDAQLPGGGWPVGGLIELLQDETSARSDWQLLMPALIGLLAQRDGPLMLVGAPLLQGVAAADCAPGAHAAARRPEATLEPFGPALSARGLPAGRLLWVRTDAAPARLWAIEQGLRCAPVAAVLAWLPLQLEIAALRRLHLAAHAHRKVLFVFRPGAARWQASPAPLRLLLASTGDTIQIDLFKRRGPPLVLPLRLAAQPLRLTALLDATRRRRGRPSQPLQPPPETTQSPQALQAATRTPPSGAMRATRAQPADARPSSSVPCPA